MDINLQLDQRQEWLQPVRKVVSPNCDDRPENIEIDLLVIHSISLPPKQYGGDYIDQLFSNQLNAKDHLYFQEIAGLQVSAHLLINRLGQVTQYVPFSMRAWHAGESVFKRIGGCNDFSIGIELEGCDEDDYTSEQYNELALITRLLQTVWTGISKDRIIGHCDIAPNRKTDPGPKFDWAYYFSLLD